MNKKIARRVLAATCWLGRSRLRDHPLPDRKG